jgi:hypothetical protein
LFCAGKRHLKKQKIHSISTNFNQSAVHELRAFANYQIRGGFAFSLFVCRQLSVPSRNDNFIFALEHTKIFIFVQ